MKQYISKLSSSAQFGVRFSRRIMLKRDRNIVYGLIMVIIFVLMGTFLNGTKLFKLLRDNRSIINQLVEIEERASNNKGKITSLQKRFEDFNRRAPYIQDESRRAILDEDIRAYTNSLIIVSALPTGYQKDKDASTLWSYIGRLVCQAGYMQNPEGDGSSSESEGEEGNQRDSLCDVPHDNWKTITFSSPGHLGPTTDGEDGAASQANIDAPSEKCQNFANPPLIDPEADTIAPHENLKPVVVSVSLPEANWKDYEDLMDNYINASIRPLIVQKVTLTDIKWEESEDDIESASVNMDLVTYWQPEIELTIPQVVVQANDKVPDSNQPTAEEVASGGCDAPQEDNNGGDTTNDQPEAS